LGDLIDALANHDDEVGHIGIGNRVQPSPLGEGVFDIGAGNVICIWLSDVDAGLGIDDDPGGVRVEDVLGQYALFLVFAGREQAGQE
jgi:hypothetical protein